MLSNVKSIYICKIIFSYVNPMKKLNLIKYNKNLQNINELSLIDYKIISGNLLHLKIMEKDKYIMLIIIL